MNGAQLLCYSFDNYDVIRGVDLAWAWMDETRDTPEEAYDILSERLRGFDLYYPDYKYQIKITTTPVGYNWLYSKFYDPTTRIDDCEVIHATTYDNPFLPDDFASKLEKKFGKRLARQQIHGEFVNLVEGRAYEFSREKHIRPVEFSEDLPIIWVMDFNVCPLVGIVAQYNNAKDCFYIIDEVVIQDDGQTKHATEEFCRRYASKTQFVEWVADLSGRSRSTSTELTDHDILADVLKKNFKNVRDSNPYSKTSVFDGVQNVNRLLDPSEGPVGIMVNERCHNLVRDLEMCAWKPGTRELNKKDKSLTHAADCLNYLCIAFSPLDTGPLFGTWDDPNA